MNGQIIEVLCDQLIIGFVDFGVGWKLVVPGCGELELSGDRARHTVDPDLFVTLIDDKTNDRGKMAVARKDDEGINVLLRHGFLIDVVEHDEIREVLFVMLA